MSFDILQRSAGTRWIFSVSLMVGALLTATTASALGECPVGSKVMVDPGPRAATAIAASSASCRVQYDDKGDQEWVHQWQIMAPASAAGASKAGGSGTVAKSSGKKKTFCMWTTTAGYTVCTPIPYPGRR